MNIKLQTVFVIRGVSAFLRLISECLYVISQYSWRDKYQIPKILPHFTKQEFVRNTNKINNKNLWTNASDILSNFVDRLSIS